VNEVKGSLRSRELFLENNTKLPDGRYMANADLENIRENFPDLYTVLTTQGYEAFDKEATRMDAEYQEWQRKIESGDIIALPDGYIAKDDLAKYAEGEQKILLEGGFSALGEIGEREWWWYRDLGDVVTGITDEQRASILATNPVAQDQMVLSPESGRRLAISGVTMIVPPARALLPEYTVRDIRAYEWALGAVNVVLIAVPLATPGIAASVVGGRVLTGVATAGAGVIGFQTAKDWAKLTPAQRAMGVGGAALYTLPILGTAARGVIGRVALPFAGAGAVGAIAWGQVKDWDNMTPLEKQGMALGVTTLLILGLGAVARVQGVARTGLTTKGIINRSIDAVSAELAKGKIDYAKYGAEIEIIRKLHPEFANKDGTLNFEAMRKAGFDSGLPEATPPELVKQWNKVAETWKEYAGRVVDQAELTKQIAEVQRQIKAEGAVS
jgi:hypothetical protein